MRKFILLIFSLLFTLISNAQEVINMERSGGTYQISCSINGAPMKMIFDTGASWVSLSSSAAKYLLQNGFLQKEDLLSIGQASIADGSVVNTISVILRDVAIGSVHVKNVQASISEGQDAPLLFGMSAIQSLGSVTIDGNKLIINKTNYTKGDIEKLDREVDNYIKNGNFSAAFNNLLKINQVTGLTPRNAMKYALCCYNMELYADCLGACSTWVNYYGDKPNDGQEQVCGLIAGSFFNLSDYKDAIPWYEKLMQLQQNDPSATAFAQYNLAQCYFNLDDIRNALTNIRSSASIYRRILGVSISDIQNGRVNDMNLGSMFQLYATCYLKANNQRAGLQLLVIAARCGDEASRQFCKENHIRY